MKFKIAFFLSFSFAITQFAHAQEVNNKMTVPLGGNSWVSTTTKDNNEEKFIGKVETEKTN